MKPSTLIVLLLALTFWNCGGKKSAESDPTAQKTGDDKVVIDTNMNVKEVIGIARIEPSGEIVTINAESAGFVKEVRFVENQPVKQGDVLVQLTADVEQSQLHQAQSRIKTQQAAISAVQATLASLEVKLANAQNTYNRNLKLLQGNAATQQSVDDNRFAVEDWQKQIAAQQANIAQQQARLEELRADIGLSQTQLTKKTLRSPMSGSFLSCNVKPGNFISSETALGDFARSGPYLALTEVDELYALRIQLGQKAFLRPQGTKEVLATGKVVFVGSYLKKKSLFSDSANNLEDRRVREVKVQLDDNSKVLIGSRVECVIELQ
jgi:multidrug resistance efflux pump